MAVLKTVIVVAVALGLATAVGISPLIARSINRPLHRMIAALGRVAQRDLTAAVTVTGRRRTHRTIGLPKPPASADVPFRGRNIHFSPY